MLHWNRSKFPRARRRRLKVYGVRCKVSGVMCKISGVRCQVLGVRCQVGERLRARDTAPVPRRLSNEI
jgi:hypothetical protein